MSDLKPTILLVEDNDEDAFLLQRAFRRENIECDLQIAADGQRAINYLAGQGRYADRALHPWPTLVLLDLKLPYVHGFEVLDWIATQPTCKDLRILVLTSSGEDYDRDRARQPPVRGYFTKPPGRDLIAGVQALLHESPVARAS
jgi:CheY-like chemotaxis protein